MKKQIMFHISFLHVSTSCLCDEFYSGDPPMIGTVGPSEKSSFADPETGAEITQYTNVGRTNRTLYFTNRPYVNGGEGIIFLSDRTGRNELFMVETSSGKIVQLTDCPGQPNVSSCAHPHRPEVYFTDTSAVYRVGLDRLQTEELVRVDERFRLGILNLNAPPWLVFEATERQPSIACTTRPGARAQREDFYRRPLSLLYRYHVDDNRLECVWSEHKQLTHVQLSPADPDLMIYSSWMGYGDARCYALDLAGPMRQPQPAFPENAAARATHECFTRRGTLYTQWMEGDFSPEAPPGTRHLYHAFRDLSGGTRGPMDPTVFRKYEIPEQNDSMVHHFTMSRDETWGVHDRLLGAPTFEQTYDHLSIFRHQSDPPQTRIIKLCRIDARLKQQDWLGLGPDVTLTDDDRRATYTSFLGGQANLCQVSLETFLGALFRDVRIRVEAYAG
jgi:oligogalacturonide lyase